MEQSVIDNFSEWVNKGKKKGTEIQKKLYEITKKNQVPVFELNTVFVTTSGARRSMSNFMECYFKEYPKKTDEEFLDIVRKYGHSGKSFILTTISFWGYSTIDFYNGTKNLLSIKFESHEKEHFSKLVDLYHSL